MTKPASTFRLFLLLSFAAMSASFIAACEGTNAGDGDHPCKEENHCIRTDGESNCEDGYTWEDPNDSENYNCVAIDIDGSGAFSSCTAENNCIESNCSATTAGVICDVECDTYYEWVDDEDGDGFPDSDDFRCECSEIYQGNAATNAAGCASANATREAWLGVCEPPDDAGLHYRDFSCNSDEIADETCSLDCSHYFSCLTDGDNWSCLTNHGPRHDCDEGEYWDCNQIYRVYTD